MAVANVTDVISTEQIIAAALKAVPSSFTAPVKTKTMFIPGFGKSEIHLDSEQTLWLPNGARVKVATDASRKATHIEEDESMHAIARPDVLTLKVRNQQ